MKTGVLVSINLSLLICKGNILKRVRAGFGRLLYNLQFVGLCVSLQSCSSHHRPSAFMAVGGCSIVPWLSLFQGMGSNRCWKSETLHVSHVALCPAWETRAERYVLCFLTPIWPLAGCARYIHMYICVYIYTNMVHDIWQQTTTTYLLHKTLDIYRLFQ